MMNLDDFDQNATVIGPSPASTQKLLQRLREVAELVSGLELPCPGFYLVYRRSGERHSYRIIRAA
ncbi:MAG: hypothetical protein AAF492_22335, partial [Verrucomicrobiota bacterium]